MPSLVKLVADSFSLGLSEQIISLNNGVTLVTEPQPIPQIEGLSWWIQYCPAGYSKDDVGFVSFFVCFSKPVGVRYVVTVKNTPIQIQDRILLEDDEVLIFRHRQLVSHDVLRNSGGLQRDKVITCDVEFEVPLAEFDDTPRIYELLLESCPQVTIVVGKDTVTINKAILTNISPVFNAMFSHDTKEARSDTVLITDFDILTIQNVKYFCLGIELNNLSVNETIEVLKFADKYDIKGLQSYFESFLVRSITANNFCDIVNYAWMHTRTTVTTKCASYFSKYGDSVRLTSDFANLEPTIVSSLVNAAVEFKSK